MRNAQKIDWEIQHRLNRLGDDMAKLIADAHKLQDLGAAVTDEVKEILLFEQTGGQQGFEEWFQYSPPEARKPMRERIWQHVLHLRQNRN